MDDKLRQILELQEQGKDRIEIATLVGYNGTDKSKRDSLSRFMRDRGYRLNNGKFIPDDKEQVEVINDSKQEIVIKENTDVGRVKPQEIQLINEDVKKQFIDFIKEDNEIKGLLEWFKTKDDREQVEVIDVIYQGIKIDLPDVADYRTTLRINGSVWSDFIEFCKKNNEFKQKDLLSMALKDYMKKHS